MLDLRRLRVLREVAKRKSFSEAANSLGYTQSAVSQQIAALERESQVTLLDRQGTVRPTAAGEVLLRHTDGILARVATAQAELAAVRGGTGGRLRIVSFPSAGAVIVPPAIARFRRDHESVELSLLPLEVPDALAELHSGECDLAVLVEAADEAAASMSIWSGIERVPLMRDRLNVMLPAAHPLAERKQIRLEELSGDPWIVGRRDYVPDEVIFLQACEQAGFEPQIAFESEDFTAIQGFVAAGVGVALVPDMALAALRSDIVVRDLVSPPYRLVVAAWLSNAWRSPASQAMVQLMKAESDIFTKQRELNRKAARTRNS